MKMEYIKQFPHCDQRVLHSPGECTYCDAHPEWQELRMAWGIGFTNEDDPDKLPCPANVARGEGVNNWGGNRPVAQTFAGPTSVIVKKES